MNASVLLTPAQIEAIRSRGPVQPELLAAVRGRRIDATAEVGEWLADASNSEDEWATYWKRRREPVLARHANGAATALANAMMKVHRAVQAGGGA